MAGVGAAASLKPLPTTLTHCIYPSVAHPTIKLLPHRSAFFLPNSLSSSFPLIRSNAENPHISRGFSASARRRGAGGGGASDSDGDRLEAEEEEEKEEEEEEGELLPFQEMRRWAQNKPAGFGEGKTYDTAVEEKLMEEMETEQARMAQLAGKRKLGSNTKNSEGTKNQNQMALDDISRVNSVRVLNLPKKKNIHRDLQIAFKGFPGLVKISPAVSGNRKTRDPICKGFAFVELESKEAAYRFAQKYSKQNVLFGKVQKEISCEVLSPCGTSNSPGQVTGGTQALILPKLANMQDEMPSRSAVDKSWKESTLLFNGADGLAPNNKEIEIGAEHMNISPSSDAGNRHPIDEGHMVSDNSASVLQKQRKQTASKKKTIRAKAAKKSKLSLPSSIARLKINERAVLTGVFSKYGGKNSSTLWEER